MQQMTYLHPGFAAILFAEVLIAMWLLGRWFRVELVQGHAPSIDGLRGFLAFGVFIHHACIWYAFLQTGAWTVPPSRVYTHLGQSTVSLFFMITGFLFYGKLLDSRGRSLDWLRLYVSRCARILPLYVTVMLATALLIALVRHSGWVQSMQAPWHEKSLTGLITAGVTWTLSYEWKFYFFLPILALTVGRFSLGWLVFSGVMLTLTGVTKALDMHALAFVGGMLAAWLGKRPPWISFARSTWANVLALGALVAVVDLFETAYAPQPLLLLSFSFALIANGATLWGLLSSRVARSLGEITYSIYLLHGLLLFIVIRFVFGFDWAAQFTPVAYWSVIGLLVPVLLVLSTLSHQWLEMPFMRKTAEWVEYLRKIAPRSVRV